MPQGAHVILQYIWKYWGKALRRSEGASAHAFVYHCLDVVAVADTWISASDSLRRRFSPHLPWLRFFIALHDFGKLSVRFQVKSREAIRALSNYEALSASVLDEEGRLPYAHGPAGFDWLARELGAISGMEEHGDADTQWARWSPWMAAVAGHHGRICDRSIPGRFREIPSDRTARSEWLQLAEQIFLLPAGLSLRDDPPPLSHEMRAFVAGFCAICDWLGSNEAFTYCIEPTDDLQAYLDSQYATAKRVLRDSGVVRAALSEGGIATALGDGRTPRQIQRYVDGLPLAPGLVLIEAPTGSGKTEAAIGLAARQLAARLVDSIVFALPTQATANAMLPRLSAIAPRLFPGCDVNIVLAHGRSAFNVDAIRLRRTVQEDEEAAVHQAEWLSQSRKRVFLGQIGVCTVDQVLLSVLPVRHHFVRSFSLGRSVLIVDEVHAYDAYMYGLLESVLQQQRAAGGSAILLSATLPWHQRQQLVRAWSPDAAIVPENEYPLLTQVVDTRMIATAPEPADRPQARIVCIEAARMPAVFPDDAFLAKVCDAAARGARIAVIVNLVADAQRIARRLRDQGARPVDLFHSRFRFRDRMQREAEVLEHYGAGAPRRGGRILVATQVVEQSLDLDFDWMVTQLCPADLLFQRLGRLHRHAGVRRPDGFGTPRCTVLLRAEDEDYGLHGKVYGDMRALWRTEQRILDVAGGSGVIEFPPAYRDWIEQVYAADDSDLPEGISKAYRDFFGKQRAAYRTARQIAAGRDELLEDEHVAIVAMTRDSERSLSVLPILEGAASETLLDGRKLDSLGELERREQIMLETVNVPGSWKAWLPAQQDDGTIRLPMRVAGLDWEAACGAGGPIRYDEEFGLERAESYPSRSASPHERGTSPVRVEANPWLTVHPHRGRDWRCEE